MAEATLPTWKRRKLNSVSATATKSSSEKTLAGLQESHNEGQAASPKLDASTGLAFMVLEVVEERNGVFHLWGTASGSSVLVRVQDFQPYLYVAAPINEDKKPATSEEELSQLQAVWNRALPSSCRIQKLEAVKRKPIMFYRPDQPDGSMFLKLCFPVGTSIKKVGRDVHGAKAAVQAAGFQWEHADMHEHEVNLLQRFLVDCSVSSGCWVHIPAAAAQAEGWSPVAAKDAASTCAVEVIAPWKAVQALTPDATQMGDWKPTQVHSQPWRQARAAAEKGDIATLRLMTINVQMAPKDGKARVAVAAADPVIAITCVMSLSSDLIPSSAGAGADNLGSGLEADGDELGSQGDETIAVEPVALPQAHEQSGSKVVVLWQQGAASRQYFDPGLGATVRVFGSEKAMLTAWLEVLRQYDPDALVTFQVKDTLGAVAERVKALRLEGGGLHISRAAAGRSTALALKKVVQYSPNWVKNQQRMASTSNQETYRVDVDGRLVIDILRHVLTACSLASFSLSDCVLSLLGRTMEVIPPATLATFAGLGNHGGQKAASQIHLPGEDAEGRARRLACYSCSQALLTQALLVRLNTIAEVVEISRATGLTASQALYNAQMIRTHSLLLRTAQRTGFLVGGRQDAVQLQESPYLIHPVENNTVGLYKEPVCVLDFASLYPSLFRAYNLSYDTLLHDKDDAKLLGDDQVFVTPTGDTFVKPGIRKGILPAILAALIQARSATRQLLKETDDAAQRSVLESRQKALKLTANALYGFTGAQASPLQCVQLADSCLALGAQSCRHARQVLDELCSSGKLGPAAQGGQVIYAQTDSLFCKLPKASAPKAIAAAQLAARLVSDAFPEHMEIKFEKVCQPFLLLHVNRYAGRAFETAEAAEKGQGVLMVKGLKSMWRQAAPILRTTLQGVLHHLLMEDDVDGAVGFVKSEVRRLLEGGCELSEFVMTGGLWRLTGQQLEKAASSAASDPEIRGPHANLAVRLQQRDKGRSFVLGERLQYVLLPGERLQDDAAEDPLTAALAGRQADYELYWRTKLQKPLQEIFATCLTPNALQGLMTGPHTKVRVDSSTAPTPEKAGKAGKGAQQMGLAKFYKASVKCLACKRAIPKAELAGKEGREPGLCQSCKAEEGRWAGVYLSNLAELNSAAVRHTAAHSSCLACHSGGLTGRLVCENGECGVLFARLSVSNRHSVADHNLRRLDW